MAGPPTTKLFLVLCFYFVFVSSNEVINIIGNAGNGTIWYQSDYVKANITIPNVLNPVTVSIIYEINSVNYPASICYNSFEGLFELSGFDLVSICPSGAYGTATNTTSAELQPISTTNSRFSSSKSQYLSNRLSRLSIDQGPIYYSTATTTAQLYVKPSSYGGFIVSIPDSYDLQEFALTLSYANFCPESFYPVGPGDSCVPIPSLDSLNTDTTIEILSGGWIYYQFSIQGYDSTTVNAVTITINGTSSDDSLNIFVQEGYYPTENWYLNTDNEVDDDDGYTRATIWTPGNSQRDEVYFVGIYNGALQSHIVNVVFNSSVCSSATSYGYGCTHDSSAGANDPLSNIYTLNATIDQNNSAGNDGSSISFDYNDDIDENYAYFQLVDYPTSSNGEQLYVRVTVANNVISDENGAPSIFAKLGSIPSEQSNQYNISTVGDISHQLVLPIINNANIPDNTWYIAVKLPVDFSIWVGVNCADNCDSEKHGTCYCGNITCKAATNDGANLMPFYTRPSSTEDSGGACVCDDIDFAQSYDCSEKNNGFVGIYLLLFFGLILIVILVSIGVPVYCIYAKSRRSRERNGDINYESI